MKRNECKRNGKIKNKEFKDPATTLIPGRYLLYLCVDMFKSADG